MAPSDIHIPPKGESGSTCPPRIQPGDGGQRSSWWASWHTRHLEIETWHLQTFIYLQKVRQEPPVLQGSNLEMVDRGLPDKLPDILDTWKLKHGTFRHSSTSKRCVRNQLSILGTRGSEHFKGCFPRAFVTQRLLELLWMCSESWNTARFDLDGL